MRNARVLNASISHFISLVRQPKNRITIVHRFFLLMTRICLMIHHFFRSFAVKETLASIQILRLKMFSSKDICKNFENYSLVSKKYFSRRSCLYLDGTIDLYEVNSRAPFGGKIGAGDSILLKYFSKVSRLHPIFHDAYGYIRSNKIVGPGYV